MKERSFSEEGSRANSPNPATAYLAERGLGLEFASTHGMEIDCAPQAERMIERLGKNWTHVEQAIWFPVRNATGATISWIARPFPTMEGFKFLTPVKGSGPPYIPKSVYEAERGTPLIITEGPVRALVLAQAGYSAIGLNGVWCAGQKGGGKVILREELRELSLAGRKVYTAFDADSETKSEVRQALIRLFFLLHSEGADVYQLTRWPQSRGKGIDDYLVMETSQDPARSPTQIITMLVDDAVPFIGTFTGPDLGHVESELGKVAMGVLHRDQLCKQLAGRLDVRVELLRAIGQEQAKTNSVQFLKEIEPWPEEVDGEALLSEISVLIRRHVVLGPHSLAACSLWVVLPYLTEVVETLPILGITSPEKRCGKTTLIRVLDCLSQRALASSNVTSASVYRVIEKFSPTLLVDEADTFLKDNEQLRGVFNSGHTRGTAQAIRCHPETHEVERFSTWGAKAIALIGELPSTIQDRSIHLKLVRKTRAETTEKFRTTPGQTWEMLRRKILRWATDHQEKVARAEPKVPAILNDRAADNWFPLLAIAQVAGGFWPNVALKALAAFNAMDNSDEDSASIALLLSLRTLFTASKQTGADGFLETSEILEALNEDKEAPWADWDKGNREKGLSDKRLKRLLKPFDVKPGNRPTGDRHRGYKFSDLRPVFERYLSDTDKE